MSANIKDLESKLEEAYKAKDFAKVNELSQQIVSALKAEEAAKHWVEENKEKLKDLADKIKTAKSLEDVQAAIALGGRMFPVPTVSKGSTAPKPRGRAPKNPKVSEDAILAIITDTPISAHDIAVQLGLDLKVMKVSEVVSPVLKALVDAGRIHKTGNAKGTVYTKFA